MNMAQDPTLEELLNAREEINISSGDSYYHSYCLRSELRMNVMPPPPLGGFPLHGNLLLLDTDLLQPLRFPSSLRAAGLWLIKDGVPYALRYGDEWGESIGTDQVGYFIHYTPPVDLGDSVDVVLRLTDDDGEYLLRAADQPIGRVF